MNKYRATWDDKRYEGLSAVCEAESVSEVYGMCGRLFFEQGGSADMPCPDYVELVSEEK